MANSQERAVMRRRQGWAGVLLAMTVVIGGCGTRQPPQIVPPVPTPTPTPVVTVTEAQALAWVTSAYRDLLRRDPDAYGVSYYGERLRDGRMTEATMRAEIRQSAEWASLHPCGDEPCPQVDWCSTKTEAQFRDLRADIGGVRLSFPTSDTRGTYFFTPTYMGQSGVFADPAKRRQALAEYKARGYTHFTIGPMFEAGYPGWPGHDYRGDPAAWVARVEEIWQAGLIPIHWLMPNGPYNVGGEADREIDFAVVERDLTPLMTAPEMQRVTCMVVAGWEVTDKAWVKTIRRATALLAWQARVFPRAYRYWHASVDNGAPCDYGEDGEGCEGKAWRAMAPYLHGQFWQTGTAGGWNFSEPDSPDARRRSFLANLRYEVMRFQTDHYAQGGVRGADGKLLDVICGEYSAYFELVGMSEDEARAYGRLAMTVPGVRGFGDGGGQ